MPEDQNYNGDWWNKKANTFLSKVLNWSQLGTSNIDFRSSKGEVYGLDSVFAYKPHKNDNQQIVIVECKFREEMKSVSKGEIQKWVNRLLEKVENSSTSNDFMNKFSPEDDAQFHVGMILTWVNKGETFNRDTLSERLQNIEVPEKMNPGYIYFIANDAILRFCAVYDEINRLRNHQDYAKIEFYFPNNSSELICDGNSIPIEALFSDFIFYKSRKKQIIKGRDQVNEYDAAICFYFGDVLSKHDLHFVDLAIRDAELHGSQEIEVYLVTPLEEIRSEIDGHNREKHSSTTSYRNIIIPDNLPTWMDDNND